MKQIKSDKEFNERKELEVTFRIETSKVLKEYCQNKINTQFFWGIKHDFFFAYLTVQNQASYVEHVIGKIDDKNERLIEILEVTIEKNKYNK